jgi:hypothetical protein
VWGRGAQLPDSEVFLEPADFLVWNGVIITQVKLSSIFLESCYTKFLCFEDDSLDLEA